MLQPAPQLPRVRSRGGVAGAGWIWVSVRAPAISMAVHLVAILTMGCWWLPPPDPSGGPQQLLAAPAERAELALPAPVTVAPLVVETEPASAAASRPMGPPSVTLAEHLTSYLDAPPGLVSRPVSDAMWLAGQGGGQGGGEGGAGGLAAEAPNRGVADGAEFFGMQAGGRRFVFVVDSSRSMRGRRWTAACQELLESVGRLHAQQEFYVIFFDAGAHPMFSPRKPEPELLPATEENLKRLRRWLPSIDFGRDTAPARAMELAIRLEPDAIFLLSDGEFTDATPQLLRTLNRVRQRDGTVAVRVPIHTIGFHTAACQAVLRPLAAENGGRYVFVPHPRQRPRSPRSSR